MPIINRDRVDALNSIARERRSSSWEWTKMSHWAEMKFQSVHHITAKRGRPVEIQYPLRPSGGYVRVTPSKSQHYGVKRRTSERATRVFAYRSAKIWTCMRTFRHIRSRDYAALLAIACPIQPSFRMHARESPQIRMSVRQRA